MKRDDRENPQKRGPGEQRIEPGQGGGGERKEKQTPKDPFQQK